MAVFELQGPDGAVYEVDAPDEASAVAGFRKMQMSQDDGMRPSMEAGLVKHAEDNLGRPTQKQSFLLGASQGATANFSDEAASGLNAGIDYITGQAPDGISAAYDKRLNARR